MDYLGILLAGYGTEIRVYAGSLGFLRYGITG